ncbi:DUF885 domain-containing protein [Rarobacter faecitabidus]|uniref:Uncharacterized protein (DUF885 family) n=1 Tax=Rarobacter faecitabidus TaxID=13243 RepID=A0A542ZE12_RARFA|nr:DUF885 domain-containing protein [Rarobacter faecitabidus]TQL58585.1 uncharacterized protein (DUF885 family) [Rarobacter faecitabidus]
MTDTSSTPPNEAYQRPATEIDRIAEAWLDTLVDLRPELGTYVGREPRGDAHSDFGPEGTEAVIDAARSLLGRLSAATVTDAVDEVTKFDLADQLRLEIESFEAGFHLRDLNVLASPPQDIRQVYDLMPTATEDDWSVIARRLANVPAAIASYRETLLAGIRQGITPAIRQVEVVAELVQTYGGAEGLFAQLVGDDKTAAAGLPPSLKADLVDSAAQAAAAYDQFTAFLRTELAPRATHEDAIGRDLYAIASRRFLGTAIDLDETYEWGREELSRMVAEQESVARRIDPDKSLEEVIAFLDDDPARKLHGKEALREWMQKTADRAVHDLNGTHFDIPEPVRTIECMIAQTDDGGIYYTGPTDDFSRPGRMWWSVPPGVEEFATWRELTTVYHEGVPGHHLQIGQAVYNRAELNAWRRLLAGTSGHAEGWALYAERLMQDLGYLDDPADLLGMLDGQRMRAARVVLDIGVHTGKPNLDGTGAWTHEWALDFFRRHVHMNDEFIKFEVNRYFGWPGQAPSYKVGQRVWEQIRDESRAREGDAFDLKTFHMKALGVGAVGLDTLRMALLG